MSTQSALKVKRIDHVTIIVKDLDATEAFYVGALGMELVPRPAFSFGGRWFQAGATQIHATIEHKEAGLAGWGDRGTIHPSRGHHYAFEVDDARLAAAEAEAAGITIAEGPKLRPDGFVQVYVRDPDDHLVELFSAPESS